VKTGKQFLALILLLSLSSCQGQNNSSGKIKYNAVGPKNGYLLLGGGNLFDKESLDTFHKIAAGNIVIIPTAMEDQYIDYDNINDYFNGIGWTDHTILHTRDRDEANSEEFIGEINKAGGVWFMGGRQWRLADAYLNTKTHDALNNLLTRNGIIGGSSAGATIQGSYLVRGDTKTNRIMMGDHEEGLGFLKNVGVDQHLLKLNRQFDLIEVIEAHHELLGIGIDENTAILVNNQEFTVFGTGYVAIFRLYMAPFDIK